MAATPKSATKWQALSPSTPAALQFPPVAPWKTRKCSKAPDSLATRGVPPATHQSTRPVWSLTGQTSATRRSGPAILWYGGEAEISREQFKARFRTERAVLIAFLKVPEEAPGCTKV